ncbi:XRE family transcriptional regulator [Rhodospirillum rubrum]|uniref:XRE family transcriptional regulator n=1 Tax=Rhodospirillum rubrum TaxID=1085 RepID=UPI001904EEBD|nr:XRE family transcriptional regulator [Rhodospirillum rubrum]MBK1663376.1 XRE family transcriptional regulator [Rhodospirillum rubrum]MBK1675548.1 XRE family transcriptional regulator [Rhodospirillum rubrum]
MPKTFDDFVKTLPVDEQEEIAVRSATFLEEVRGLRALRALAARSQEQIAQSLHIKQPSVHQMERRADLCISTLRRFVEATGGRLELRVDLPGHPPIILTGLGDLQE